MPYYSKEIIEEVKKMDLLTYLRNYEPNELVHFSGDTYMTKTHDSLKISNGLWNWCSMGFGGKTALEYLIKVKDYSFMEAMEAIISQTKIHTPISYKQEAKSDRNKLILPKKSDNFDKVKSYLMNRGIDQDIIQECIDNNLIYEELSTHNVVFVGYDENKNPRYAGCRATNDTRYMRDATGSDKTYSFRLESDKKSDKVHLFESVIDLLSYATILELKNKPWYEENMIALAGVYQPAKIIENSKIPLTIEQYLAKNPNISNIILHFDMDIAGRQATHAFQKVIQKKYTVIDAPTPIGKDINDYLCVKLGLKKIKQNERSRYNERI